MTDAFDALRAALVAALENGEDEPASVRAFDALAWLASAAAPLATPDPVARQAAVDALHRAWQQNPEHTGALGEARALLAASPAGAPAAAMLRALHDALNTPRPPAEAALGAALDAPLEALRAAADPARDALIRADARASVAAHMKGFTLPFRRT